MISCPSLNVGRNMKNFDFSACATTGATLVEIPS